MSNAELAKATGLTNLDLIANHPERLERAYWFAKSMESKCIVGSPLRHRVRLSEYADRAMALLTREVE